MGSGVGGGSGAEEEGSAVAADAAATGERVAGRAARGV